jgi:norsolorinic acid ketoreductase
LLEALVNRPNTTVIAGVRNLADTSSKSLESLSTGSGSRVITVTIDSNDDSSAKKAVEFLQTKYGIDKIDVVIANAGIAKYYGSAEITPISEVREHFEVNTIGALLLFQATAPLLKRSTAAMFVGISTGLASITNMGDLPAPTTAYGLSKVALNYFIRKIHFENPDITAFVMSPGSVYSYLQVILLTN